MERQSRRSVIALLARPILPPQSEDDAILIARYLQSFEGKR